MPVAVVRITTASELMRSMVSNVRGIEKCCTELDKKPTSSTRIIKGGFVDAVDGRRVPTKSPIIQSRLINEVFGAELIWDNRFSITRRDVLRCIFGHGVALYAPHYHT